MAHSQPVHSVQSLEQPQIACPLPSPVAFTETHLAPDVPVEDAVAPVEEVQASEALAHEVLALWKILLGHEVPAEAPLAPDVPSEAPPGGT